MQPWPEYAITAVRYDKDRRHIVSVKGFGRPSDGRWGTAFERTREQIQ